MRRYGLAIWIGVVLLLNACAMETSMGGQASAREAQGASAPSLFDTVAHTIAGAIEVAGIGVIVLGGLAASALFIHRVTRRQSFESAYHQYRSNLGRGILLGLEFLVAADIIGTVAVDPTFANLGVLALIVLIRTFLSFSLEVEIDGHFPWRDTELKERSSKQDRL